MGTRLKAAGGRNVPYQLLETCSREWPPSSFQCWGGVLEAKPGPSQERHTGFALVSSSIQPASIYYRQWTHPEVPPCSEDLLFHWGSLGCSALWPQKHGMDESCGFTLGLSMQTHVPIHLFKTTTLVQALWQMQGSTV